MVHQGKSQRYFGFINAYFRTQLADKSYYRTTGDRVSSERLQISYQIRQIESSFPTNSSLLTISSLKARGIRQSRGTTTAYHFPSYVRQLSFSSGTSFFTAARIVGRRMKEKRGIIRVAKSHHCDAIKVSRLFRPRTTSDSSNASPPWMHHF